MRQARQGPSSKLVRRTSGGRLRHSLPKLLKPSEKFATIAACFAREEAAAAKTAPPLVKWRNEDSTLQAIL